MNRPQMLKALIKSMDADLLSYEELALLLDVQYSCASRTDSTGMRDVVSKLLPLVDALTRTDAARRQYMERLAAPEPCTRLEDALKGVDAVSKTFITEHWRKLAAQIGRCQALSARNADLLARQSDSLDQALYGEKHVYTCE